MLLLRLPLLQRRLCSSPSPLRAGWREFLLESTHETAAVHRRGGGECSTEGGTSRRHHTLGFREKEGEGREEDTLEPSSITRSLFLVQPVATARDSRTLVGRWEGREIMIPFFAGHQFSAPFSSHLQFPSLPWEGGKKSSAENVLTGGFPGGEEGPPSAPEEAREPCRKIKRGN